ncbi:MAG: HNH endonuclease [Chloroflexi bacterium]|nr:HNH endonuclease [Chloroflexota bacterium]
MAESKTISDLVMEYFRRHPNEDLPMGPVVDWVTEEYLRSHPSPPRDPWRAIRKLHQEGKLVKVRKGVHRYDPERVEGVHLFDFPPEAKEAIFRRDSYRCVVCGKGIADGVEIHADHIKPKDRGGDNSVENGQTLCTQHNNIKKNYSQTEAGKRYFIRIYEKALASDDQNMIRFCKDVFDAYNRHGINGHIRRPNGR